MNATRFDAVARNLTKGIARRRVFRALGGVLGVASLREPGKTEAKKKEKKPLPVNQFGCLDVGAKCRGRDALCCSGICEGKKPKKGKKDKRVCVAHNEGGCGTARSLCVTNSPAASNCNPASASSVCFATTGNAGFCADSSTFVPASNCQPCTTDTECVSLGFGPGSACVILQGGVSCDDGCAASGGRACLAPGI